MPWSCRTRPRTRVRAWPGKWPYSRHSHLPPHQQSKSQFLMARRMWINKVIRKLHLTPPAVQMSAMIHQWVDKSFQAKSVTSFQLARNCIQMLARCHRQWPTSKSTHLRTCNRKRMQITKPYLSLSNNIWYLMQVRFTTKKLHCHVTKLCPLMQRNTSYLYIVSSNSRASRWADRICRRPIRMLWTKWTIVNKTWFFKRMLHSTERCTAISGIKTFNTNSNPGKTFLTVDQPMIPMVFKWSLTKNPSEQQDPHLHRYSDTGPTRVTKPSC